MNPVSAVEVGTHILHGFAKMASRRWFPQGPKRRQPKRFSIMMLCLVMQPVLSFRQDGASHWQMRQPGVIRPVFLEERKVMLSYVMLHCWGRAAGVFSEFLLKCHDAWFSLARFSLAMSGLCSSAPCGGGAMWGWLALLLFLPSIVTMTLFWCKVISRENSGLNRNTCGKWKSWQDMAGRATSESDPQRCSGFRYCFFSSFVWRWFWWSRLV